MIWVAGATSHVGLMLFCDGDRLLQFRTHVSVKHDDAQFDYSHLTSRVKLPKTGKLSRTDKWMSNTDKDCSDPHIFIRDELARKSPPVLLSEIFVQINLLLGATSIQGLIRNFDVRFERNWKGGTVWPIHQKCEKRLNSKEEEVHWAGSDQWWARIKCTPRFSLKTSDQMQHWPRSFIQIRTLIWIFFSASN